MNQMTTNQQQSEETITSQPGRRTSTGTVSAGIVSHQLDAAGLANYKGE